MNEGLTKDERRNRERKRLSQNDSAFGNNVVIEKKFYLVEKNKNFPFKQIN